MSSNVYNPFSITTPESEGRAARKLAEEWEAIAKKNHDLYREAGSKADERAQQLREAARAFGQILSFLRERQEEVVNGVFGVVGYRATLTVNDTAYLCDLADQQERKINAVLQPNQ